MLIDIRWVRLRPGLLGLGLSLLGTGSSAVPVSAAPQIEWTRVLPGMRGSEATALAYDRETGRLAIGDSRGVLSSRSGELARRILHRGPVRDLAFVPGIGPDAGALLVATDAGAYRVEAQGRVLPLALGPGASSRPATRIAALPGIAALATASGVRISSDLTRWRPLSVALPSGPARAVALRPDGSDFECWTLVAGRVWRTQLRQVSGTLVVGASQRETLPLTGRDGEPVDLVLDLPGAGVTIVMPSALATREPGGAWRIRRPALPPGARARRLSWALGRFWLSTDRGLLEADSLDGPWRRVSGAAGRAGIRDVVSSAREIYVATESGLVAGRLQAQRTGAPGSHASAPTGPGIEDVHRAAVAYLNLQRHDLESMRRRVNRRAWMPVATLRAGYDDGSDRGWDVDEAFVSGDLRRLNDRDEAHSRDWELGVTLIWDLPGLVYHPEEIDISRETRALIELRDDVLDEITQLYFERRRVLAEWAARADSAERHRLRLRADELAAGIDAWTGGWFSRHGAFD
jgi:hypothetical protein